MRILLCCSWVIVMAVASGEECWVMLMGGALAGVTLGNCQVCWGVAPKAFLVLEWRHLGLHKAQGTVPKTAPSTD
jgi:hypothetical protein